MRKALVTARVSYHHALTRPGQPQADFSRLGVHDLAGVDLAAYDLVIVPRWVSGDAPWLRRHQLARFLDAQLLRNFTPEQCHWHGKGPRWCNHGRVLAGTLEPDCHVGYRSDVPRPPLRQLFTWAPAHEREATAVGAV